MKSNKLREFIREIQYVNRNPQDNRVLSLLEDTSTNPEIYLEKGTELFRSRIISDRKHTNKEKGFFGYGSKDSFVPPREKTSDMRANYRYIPYLYCSAHRYISIIEVRPRFGAEVSVATIKVQDELKLLDFTMQKHTRKIVATKKNLFEDLSELFSKPIANSDDMLDYIPTQYIAEYAKNLGYDGISFKSSLYTGVLDDIETSDIDAGGFYPRINIVIFNYDKCIPVASNVYKIADSYLECEQIDADVQRQLILSPVSEALRDL
ncbi:MAG: RES family NAD+ phosphorylase [Oscillospiraceae bacterium]|nr:RES family NAD+ phosphorylase [Oscillospiraceae bacterium]